MFDTLRTFWEEVGGIRKFALCVGNCVHKAFVIGCFPCSVCSIYTIVLIHVLLNVLS